VQYFTDPDAIMISLHEFIDRSVKNEKWLMGNGAPGHERSEGQRGIPLLTIHSQTHKSRALMRNSLRRKSSVSYHSETGKPRHIR